MTKCPTENTDHANLVKALDQSPGTTSGVSADVKVWFRRVQHTTLPCPALPKEGDDLAPTLKMEGGNEPSLY